MAVLRPIESELGMDHRNSATVRRRVILLAALGTALAVCAVASLAWREGLSVPTLVCGALGLAVAALSVGLLRALARALAPLHANVRAMSDGDLSRRLDPTSDDEFAAIARSLDDMNHNMSALVADIRSEATFVAQASKSLATDTGELSQRTERQAASLEQTSAGVQDLSSSVRQNALDARAVEQLASSVHAMAESGGTRMREAVDTMHAIRDSSQRVEDIIGVIDGIAFQTNILALNAAVEAARAGENGRGFAVVAAEVRTLALRSSGAAREIKRLIAASGEHVRSGAAHIDEVGALLANVVAGIGEVAGNVRAITSAAEQQSNGLSQMSEAIRGLDDITQENAKMVEQTSSASLGLGERAQKLTRTVGSFRLTQGTADEAFALVQKAVALYRRRGTACLAEITDPANGFNDRDMYVFAWDRALVYHAFAGKAHNVGKCAREIIGTDITQLTHDVWAVHDGGDWVDYEFLNPTTGQVAPKTSFVVPVSDDLVLGCGIYKTVQRR